uniref:Rapamycin-insensitive companion of mTOR N-terminal domain-containing protein n=1 Tax=Panagrolaimus sp. JU765 TaxID=591449 RepID=A0AC34QGH4_9BILA
MQRPANLVLPASDARTRLKQRTKIHGRTPDFVPTIRKKIFRYSEDKTSAQTIIEFLQNLPSNQDFPTVGSFLNELSKLLQNVDDPKDAALNELVIKTCLPWTNFDEPQIRALTFRLIRHSFHRRSQLQSLLLVQLELAVIRSLDLSDFEKEKEEAFKLLCRMIFFYKDSPVQSFSKFEDSSFTLFPMSTIKCLVALLSEKLPNPEGKPELSKPGKLFLPSLAILVDLAITDSNLIFKCAGTSWIVKSISELGSNSSNIAALICRLILKWMDTVEMREKASLHLVIEQIFAPLIDFGFFYQRAGEVKQDDFPQVEVTRILESVSTMLLSIIRSWTGIFVCGAINEHGEIISCSPLKLLGFLGFGTAFNPAMVKIRDMVISICCEFVDLPYATKPFANWSDAVVFYSKMYTPDKYKTSLRDDFVVGEMEILQNSGVLKPDVVDCLMTFRAVASYVLINAGLPQALARLIMARPDDPISIRATLLLADLLRSGASFLPEERKIMLLSTPSLIQAVSERLQISGKGSRGIHLLDPPTFPNTDNAMILFHRIDQLNDIAFNRLPIQTQLTNIEIFVKGGDDFSKAAEVRERSMSLLEPDERFDKLVQVESEFFSKTSAKELDLKDLESIIYFLEAENGVLIRKHRHNDKMHTFFSKIFTIILPANERFVTDAGSFNGKIIKSLCRAIKLLMPMAKTEPHYGELIERFLAQFKEQLDPVILYKGTFSPKNILNTGAHYYFAILAAIGSTLNGRQFIEESGILQM